MSNLNWNMDARDWAAEFMRLFSDRRGEIDEGLMLAWFANAIMCGYDVGRSRLRKETESTTPGYGSSQYD